MPAVERLLARIVKTDSCWLWPGATNGRGYGVIGGDAPERRMTYVHRLMWQYINGPIPDGLEILHSCDVRNCVRPDHLSTGTHAENVRDQVEKDRHRKGVQMYWSAKLSEADVREIRRRHAAGETASSLARAFSVSPSQAENIVNRRRWKHVS